MILKNQKLKGYDGKEIEDVDLKKVIIQCLNFENEKLRSTADQKVRSYLLSMSFMANDEVELKSEDIVFIKTRMLETYTPLVFGQVMEILEPSK